MFQFSLPLSIARATLYRRMYDMWLLHGHAGKACGPADCHAVAPAAPDPAKLERYDSERRPNFVAKFHIHLIAPWGPATACAAHHVEATMVNIDGRPIACPNGPALECFVCDELGAIGHVCEHDH